MYSFILFLGMRQIGYETTTTTNSAHTIYGNVRLISRSTIYAILGLLK